MPCRHATVREECHDIRTLQERAARNAVHGDEPPFNESIDTEAGDIEERRDLPDAQKLQLRPRVHGIFIHMGWL